MSSRGGPGESRKRGSFDCKGLGTGDPGTRMPPPRAVSPAWRPAGQELEHLTLLKAGESLGPC